MAELSGVNTLENFIYGDTPAADSIKAVVADINQAQNENWELQIYSLSQASNNSARAFTAVPSDRALTMIVLMVSSGASPPPASAFPCSG